MRCPKCGKLLVGRWVSCQNCHSIIYFKYQFLNKILWKILEYYRKVFGDPVTIPGFLKIKNDLKMMNDFKKGEIILDLGCGRGEYYSCLNKLGVKIIHFDVSENNLKYLKKKFYSYCILGDGTYLPFKNNIFDHVICLQVIEHIYNFELLIEEIYRITKEKGSVVIATPCKLKWESPIKIRKGLMNLPEGIRQAILGQFNISDEKLLRNYFGHINVFNKNALIILFEKYLFEYLEHIEYVCFFGSLSAELNYSFREELRPFIFVFSSFIAHLDQFLGHYPPWLITMRFKKKPS